MKTPMTPWEQANIRRAKGVLRRLWQNSGLSQQALLTGLAEAGQSVKKTTLSMWLNPDSNAVRPKAEALAPLVQICLGAAPASHSQEILDELEVLLGYGPALETPEMLRNRLSLQLDQGLVESLSAQEATLRDRMDILDELLAALEPRLFEYDLGSPVVRVEADDKYLVRELLGVDSLKLASQWRTQEGDYEVPLTQVQSLDTLTDVVNTMNEGIRILRSYVEKHLLESGSLALEAYPRVETFVSYAWEISDRLLHHNRLCRSIPHLRRTLLRLMATCWGIRYLLRSQEGRASEVEFQNILQRKGMENAAEIACSTAVYMGVLARQILKLYRGHVQIQRGLNLAQQAQHMLTQSLAQLPTEHETFYYRKELANLCYDAAALLLWHRHRDALWDAPFQILMQAAYSAYNQVLGTVNLFHEGLTEPRATHLRSFYLISRCWVETDFQACVCEINKLAPGQHLNENFWTLQIAKTIACGVLSLRSSEIDEQRLYRDAAQRFLQQALLVPGLHKQTQQELREDFVLSQVLGEHSLAPVQI
ncbi:MAG: hypothetical protein ACO1RX_07080 [Candidatus Sericytochromatia bacterium]